MVRLRRLLPAVVAVAALAAGFAIGTAVGDDDGAPAPPAARIVTAAEVPAPCQQALRLGTEAVNAAARAIAVAQARMTAPAGSPGAPSEGVVTEAAGQAQALRQQLGTLGAACDQAQGALTTSTTAP